MEIPAPFHVLIIEDSPDDRADIRQMLLRGSPRHYKFTETETGSAALRALRETANPPDCILLDFNLPDMNALDLLAEWQADTPSPGCPVVVLTGMAECGPRVIGAGAQDFVGKSWASPESLTRAIENAVERYALTRQRQAAYEALRSSEQRLDLGLRVAGVALAEVDYTTGLNHLSAESARQFGLGASAIALPRARVHATFHPDDRAALVTRIAQSLDPAGAGWFAMDHRVVWPSGEVRWLRVRKQVTFDGEGRARRPVRAVLATFDITTEKRAEEQLRLFEQAVTGIRDVVMITEAEPIDDPGPRIVYVNPAFTAMTGYTAAEAIGRSPRLLQGPKSSRAALDKIRAALEKWQPVTVEVTNYRKDGTEFEVEFSIVPVANEHGWFTHWVSLQRDVSERNRAAEALAGNAALFAKIIEQAPGGVYVMDAQLRVREANTGALEVFASVQPVIGRELGEVLETLWGPELGRECTAIVRRTLETGERYVSPRFDYRRQDLGVELAYEWETQRLTLPDGQHGAVCYFQDVTARERASAALRTSEAHMRLATEATEVGIWEWNVLTNQIRWDAQMFRLYGITPTPDGFVPYQTWAGALLPEDLADNEATLQDTVRRLGRSTRTFRIGRAGDGACRHIEAVEIVRTNAQGQAEWVLGTNLDVTERKQAEEALRAQVAERQNAEAQVHLINRDLEQRVAVRVAELAAKTQLLATRNAELESVRRALEAKAAELARASGFKSEFLATMSHELRTPLNSILIFSEQLAENKPGTLTGKQVEFAQHIRASGTDLQALINDVLDLSKIESGTVTVEVEAIPFAELRRSLERNFRHAAEAKRLAALVHFAAGLPAVMDSDPTRLQQILRNLLANSVKFTAHGQVEVRVDLATQGWTPEHPVLSRAPQVVAFAVQDTGIGIAPEKQRLIFEAFQQADAGTARKYGGTGLGLAISRELAGLLGGEITLASALGQGSTFTLFLPLHYAGPDAGRPAPAKVPPAARAPALQLPAPPPPQAPDAVLRGRKVLVVDDDARNIFALTSLLENHEMDVLSTTNGRSAIEIIQNTPDLSLVLMDIMMPEMDGFETMKEIRNESRFSTLPILALTAKAMKGDREKCLDAGASDYIAKPVNTDQLLSLMRVWLCR